MGTQRQESIDELMTLHKYCTELKEYNTFEKYAEQKYDLKKPVRPTPKPLTNDSVIRNPMWEKGIFRTLLAIKAWNIKHFSKKRGIGIAATLVVSFLFQFLKGLSSALLLPLSIFSLVLIIIFAVSVFSYLLSLILIWLPDPEKVYEFQNNRKYNDDHYSEELEKYNSEMSDYEAETAQYKHEYDQYYQTIRRKHDELMDSYGIQKNNRTTEYIEAMIQLMQEKENISSIEAARDLVDHYQSRKRY